ncbi:MAG: hypothetical protein GTO00_09385 [Deltaproteobacteria bacterium]|nr:hypothetical protein [Deltaproteobacteria bacterium]
MERYLEDEIVSGDRDDLEKHLAVCSTCSNLLRDLSEIDSLLQNISEKQVDPPHFLKTRIMARIEEEKTPAIRVFSLKPIYALSAAVCAVILVGVYAYFSRPTVVRVVNLTPSKIERPADFYAPQFTNQFGERVIHEVKIFFYSPDARKVSIIGDFNDWDLGGLPLTPTGRRGLWEVNLRLKEGVYSYNFLIDGKIIVPDPNSSTQSPDGFGGMNSILFVKKGETI